MKKYYDLVMAYAISKITKMGIDEGLPGIAPPGASEEERWAAAKAAFSGSKLGVITEWGLIDFDPNELTTLVKGKTLSYDKYLEVMKSSAKHMRIGFLTCYYDARNYYFKGKIEKINKNASTICFKKIYIAGTYFDGKTFTDKEDHVWMSLQGFEKYNVGDCLRFNAEIYRYVRCANTKRMGIDFGLRNPTNISKVDNYELPSDEELSLQSINQIICEVCLFNQHCDGFCIASQEWKENMKKQLLAASKKDT